MSADDGPFCPECGEPVSATADYCMHCYVDFPADFPAGSGTPGTQAGDGTDPAEPPDPGTAATPTVAGERSGTSDDRLLDPDGIVDDSLTVLVGVVGGLVVGLVGGIVLGILTGHWIGLLLGMVAWLGATAYLVRRPSVQAAVSKTGYAVAGILLLVPLIAVAPGAGNATLTEQAILFVMTLGFVAPLAGVAAAVGWVASRFVPGQGGDG